MTKKNKIILLPSVVAVIVVSCFVLFIGTTSNHNETIVPTEEEEKTESFATHYRLSSPPIPDTLLFAGENVPIDRYDVREALDRENGLSLLSVATARRQRD